MITNLRPFGDDTVVASGELYDVGKVLDAMGALMDSYAAFAAAKGLEAPYTLSIPKPARDEDDHIVKLLKSSGIPFKLPYAGHTMRIVAALVAKEQADYDAGGLRHVIEAPPFRFNLFPLGTNPLYANFGLCREPDVESRWLTVDGRPGTDYDPSPVLRVYRHLPKRPEETSGEPRPIDEYFMPRSHRKLITEFLDSQRSIGIEFHLGVGGFVDEPVCVRFPHASFCAGRGDMRIAVIRAGGD